MREVHRAFGETAEAAQTLEVEAGNAYLAFLSWAHGPRAVTDEEREFYRAIVTQLNRATLGRLLKVLQDMGEFEASLSKVLQDALERRNYLMHSFFRSHNFGIYSDSGRAAMLDELADIRHTLDHARAVLDGIANNFVALAGRPKISPADIAGFMSKGRRLDL